MYSVEEEEKQKSEEKPDEETVTVAVEHDEGEETEATETEPRLEDDEKIKEFNIKKDKVAWKEDDFETTEYDNSTDDESLKMIFSSTDQVIILKNFESQISLIYFSPTVVLKYVPGGPAPVHIQHFTEWDSVPMELLSVDR